VTDSVLVPQASDDFGEELDTATGKDDFGDEVGSVEMGQATVDDFADEVGQPPEQSGLRFKHDVQAALQTAPTSVAVALAKKRFATCPSKHPLLAFVAEALLKESAQEAAGLEFLTTTDALTADGLLMAATSMALPEGSDRALAVVGVWVWAIACSSCSLPLLQGAAAHGCQACSYALCSACFEARSPSPFPPSPSLLDS